MLATGYEATLLITGAGDANAENVALAEFAVAPVEMAEVTWKLYVVPAVKPVRFTVWDIDRVESKVDCDP